VSIRPSGVDADLDFQAFAPAGANMVMAVLTSGIATS